MVGSTWTFVARGRVGFVTLGCALYLSVSLAARADQLTAKDDTLHGKLISMGEAGVMFETAYAKDKLAIEYKDITDLRTDGPVQVLHGEDRESIGPLQGIEDGKLRVGADAVEIATITLGTPTQGVGWRDRMRSNFRYWRGALDFGFGLTRSRVDETVLTLGLSLARKKAPTRFFLDVLGAYGKQETEAVVIDDVVVDPETETRSQDSLYGRVRGEYDLTKKVYLFGTGEALYDGVQQISIRGIPKSGVGYRIYETKSDLFQVEAGGAWLYEKYFGGEDNNFWAVAFGSWLDIGLWYGSRFTWRMDYLPSIDDWIGDYIIRNELALTVPIFDPFKLKLALFDEYDSTPAEKDFTVNGVRRRARIADYNKLVFTVGVSLGF